MTPKNKYQFNGIERVDDLGINLDFALFRSYDAAVGRWWQVDPEIKFSESPFAAFANNPVIFIDPLGADTLRQIGPDTYHGGNVLEGVTVSAKRPGSNYDQSTSRYGFSGTFAQWQNAYGFQNWSYDNASNYWSQVYSKDYDKFVYQRDSLEEDRIALQKLWLFSGGFAAIGSVYGLGGSGARLPTARGFSFVSPVGNSPLAQVQINKLNGDAFRDKVAGVFRSQGYDVSSEVFKSTPFGRRYIDLEISLNGRVLGGVETKFGLNARYTVQQRAADYYLWKVKGYRINVLNGRP